MENINKEAKDLFLALFRDDTEGLKKALDDGTDIEAKDSRGFTVLLYASLYGLSKMVQLLLNNGADIEAKDNDGLNALTWAVLKENIEMVQLLLNNGADIEAKDERMETVLLQTSSFIREECLNIIDETDKEPIDLLLNIFDGNIEMTQLLIDNGANIEAKDYLGNTALLSASRYGLLDMVQLLIDNGANIEAKDDIWGKTSLIKASENGHLDVVKYLINNGANIEAKTNKRIDSLLKLRVNFIKNKLVKFTFNKLLNVLELLFGILAIKKSNGETSLTKASDNGHKAVVNLLIEQGASLKDIKYKEESYIPHKIEKVVMHLFNLLFKGTPIDDITQDQIDQIKKRKNLNNYIGYCKYLQEERYMMSNPQKLVKILTNFTIDTPIKYTTHEWRNRIDKKYFDNFDLFLEDVCEQFKTLGSELKALSPNLYHKIEGFIVSTENPNSWKSMKDLKPWVESKNEPFDFPIANEHILFKTIIESFKNEIEIRGNRLQEIFLAHKKRLGRAFQITISDNLKGEKFYTDVETFKNAVDEIFREIEKYAKEQNEYKIEVELFKPENNFIELHIIHINSTSTREAEELLERIKQEKGDSVLRRYFKNLCDWEIKASHKNNHFTIDCFNEEIKNIEKAKGFTHIMRFYK